MFFNEGFVMMRHVSPLFARQRDKFIKKFGENIWYRFHGTLDYTWIGLVTIGLIVNSNSDPTKELGLKEESEI